MTLCSKTRLPILMSETNIYNLATFSLMKTKLKCPFQVLKSNYETLSIYNKMSIYIDECTLN